MPSRELQRELTGIGGGNSEEACFGEAGGGLGERERNLGAEHALSDDRNLEETGRRGRGKLAKRRKKAFGEFSSKQRRNSQCGVGGWVVTFIAVGWL